MPPRTVVTTKTFSGRAAQFRARTRGASGASRAQSRGGTSVTRRSASFDETKYFDTGINAGVLFAGTDWSDTEVPCDNFVNSSGTAAAYTNSALVPSAIGSGYGQVNGNRYKLKKIRIRGTLGTAIQADQADVPAPCNVRLMLVMDEQPNGAQAQGEDIMQDIGTAAENLYSYKRVASTSGRFRILKDQFMVLQPAVTATDHATNSSTNSNVRYSQQFSMQYSPKVPKLVNIKSGNATPTVAGLVNCNIFLLLAGVNGTTVTTIVIQAASRCYYVD